MIYTNSEQVLCKDTKATDYTVKKYYSKLCPPVKCNICHNKCIHNNLPLILQLDHIDGDHYNSDPTNLRWLCPNCHSQTDTYCGRNTHTRIEATDEEIIDALERNQTKAAALREFKMDTGRTDYWTRINYIIETYKITVGSRATTFFNFFDIA